MIIILYNKLYLDSLHRKIEKKENNKILLLVSNSFMKIIHFEEIKIILDKSSQIIIVFNVISVIFNIKHNNKSFLFNQVL